MQKKKSFKHVAKRLGSLSLAMLLVLCYILPQFKLTAFAQETVTEVTTLCNTEIVTTNSWEGGYQAEVVITNISDTAISDWYITMHNEDVLTDVWNASLASSEDSEYTIQNAGWNKDIPAGGSVSVGYTANCSSDTQATPVIKVFGTAEGEADTQEPVKEELTAGTSYIFEENGYTVKYSIEDVWVGNYNAKVEITNTSSETIHNWMIAFACDDEINDIYNGKIEERKDCIYYIKNVEYNQDINVGGTVTFGFQVSYTDSADLPEGFVVHEVESFVPVSSYQVETVTVNEWEGGYTGEIRITNLGDKKLEDWCLSFTSADEIVDLWNADVVSVEDGVYTIRNTDSRQNIEVGGSFTVGFRANGDTHELDVVHMCVVNSGADMEDTTEVPSEDVSEAPSEDISEKPSEDISEASSEDISEEPSEDISEDPSEDSSEDVSEDPSEEPSEDTSEDIDPEESNIIVNTDNLRAGDLEDTYYVDGEIYELTGTLTGAGQVAALSYVLQDVNDTILLEGTLFDRANGVTPKDSWTIPEFGLAIGVNILTFTLELNNDVVKEQCIRLIDVTGANMDRVNIDLNDSDEDGLNNYFESVLKTDLELADTDGDGISDFDEFLYVGTDPLLYDTDGNGVSDGEEDYDSDGLNSIEECTYQTNVISEDTDDDGISDTDEIRVTFTDPLVADTDEDGLKDGTENKLSLNPLVKDTDGDGVLDGEEVYTQTTETVIGDEESVIESVSVTVPSAGEIDEQFFIADASGWDEIAANVVGIVGVPVEIATDIEFEEATLTFQYDPALLNGASEDNLGILWYDKENLEFVEMENVTIDKTQHTVSCVTTHFSEYLVVDMETWQNAWLSQTDYSQYREPLDVAIMSDSTAAVSFNWVKGFAYIDVSRGFLEEENVVYGYFNANEGNTHTAWMTDQLTYDRASESVFWYHFYSGGTTRDRNGKYGDGFEELVEMFTSDEYQKLNSDNPKVALFTYDGYLTQTAEQDQKVLDSCEKLKELGVTIYAVSETDATVSVIEQAAVSSGGVHFNINSQEEGKVVWNEIHKLHRNTAHLDVDSDGDGLSDGYEIYGMRIQNGKVITTDPENPDTDGDDEKKDGTRNDGSEMGKMTTITVKVEATGTKREFTIFKMISNPNESDNLSDKFIYVDSLDYMPYSNTFDRLLNSDKVEFTVPWTNAHPVDREGNGIKGLANMHNSLDILLESETPENEYDNMDSLFSIYTKWITRVHMLKTIFYIPTVGGGYLPVEFLEHFMGNSGTTIEYEGYLLSSESVRKAFPKILEPLQEECQNVLQAGETKYIATSPEHSFEGIRLFSDNKMEDVINKSLNLTSFISVNTTSAMLVAECTFDGEIYTIKYHYYILDYYDWDPQKVIELYVLNVYGLGNSYTTIGEISGIATFTYGGEILNVVTDSFEEN